MKETRMFTIRTLLFVVFIWLFSINNALGVEPSWMGKRKLNGEATGIIRDIVEQNGAIFVGAENGLFKVVGNTSKRFTGTNSPLGKGYIADLHLEGDTLYISEFGNGVFTFSLSSGVFSKLPIPDDLAVKAWSALPYESSLVVSTLSGLVLLSGAGGPVIIKDAMADGSRIRNVYSLTIYKDLVAASEANSVILMDEQLREVKVLHRADYFPALSKITYVKTIGDKLYVGGVGGVYWFQGNESVFYPAAVPKNQLKDVECIIEDSEGNIWIAAGGLFVLDETAQALRELEFGKPRYSFDQIRAVQAIHQLENKQFIVASTQLGLLALDLNRPAINYLHEKSFPFRNDIYSIINFDSNRSMAKSRDHWFWLNSETGKLDRISSKNFEKLLIPVGSRLLVPGQGCEVFEYHNSEFINTQAVYDPSGYCAYLKAEHYTKGKVEYIYYQAPTHAGFVKLENSELSHHVNAPKDLRFLESTPDIPTIMLDKKNVLYLMVEQGVWVRHELDELKRVFIYCMYADTSSIYFCTSGKGLKRFDIATKKLVAGSENEQAPRFIRAGYLDSSGNHWLATNKGLVFLNKDYLFRFDGSDAIVDTDFNYRGILPLNEQNFVLVGDQLSYVINTKTVSRYIEKRREHKAQTAIVNVEFSPDVKQPARTSPNHGLELDAAPDEMIFEFASADYVYPHLHKLEYRLKGFHEDWQELPANIGTVAYSGLSFGSFDFQVRVVDSKSQVPQPISRYPFKIARPFWFTWQAYLLYVFALILSIWLIVLLIKRHMAERSRVLAAVIEQKQSALLESNRSITELLNKKEKIFSNLANEIKTPVMRILNPLTELRGSPLTAAIRHKIDLVYDNAGRLRLLTDQLAAVERIEHISEQILQRYDISNTLEFLVETWRPEAAKKQLVLSCDCDLKQPVLLIQDSLEALLNYILMNAIAYTQPGGQVRIRGTRQADQFILSIKDNGPGMSEHQLEFVIARFGKGPNYNGSTNTGIGLNLANALALANDGWLEIKSEPETGTEVSVHLPFNPALAIEKSEAIEVVNEPDRMVAEQSAQYRQSNLPVILVIERSHEACEYIINLLGESFNCYSTQSGVQALELIPVLQPDIVLSELNILDISGVTFTERLREQNHFADVPVMILTAASDYTSKLKSFKASVNDYLVKPVERDELISRIESNLTYTRLAHRHNAGRDVDEEAENNSAYVKAILPRCDNEKDRKFIVKFLDIIESNYQDERFNRSRAAALLAMSERQLNRTLSKLLPDNLTMFLKKYRLEKSMPLLEQGLQITQIAFEVGFGSGAYYSRCFKQVYGVLPSEYEFPCHGEPD
ncbi:response regulator [uncultured Alteromonas sp.]|jgi:signal transduction histidine kinase/DNA-binding response OmpR family regulator/ligand-binding sensor domain-containing protein|uniref:response regulator n=1 Tax=uncultured Alteromonas sp. TaxID=179113 RepID=UPI0025E9A2AF|nr:response regulator [uncultured Alteromonas sp.]